jgi:hypothetical protein
MICGVEATLLKLPAWDGRIHGDSTNVAWRFRFPRHARANVHVLGKLGQPQRAGVAWAKATASMPARSGMNPCAIAWCKRCSADGFGHMRGVSFRGFLPPFPVSTH